MPNGELFYCTSPMIPAKVGPILGSNELLDQKNIKGKSNYPGIQKGTWSFHNGTIICVLKFTSCNISTEVNLKLII